MRALAGLLLLLLQGGLLAVELRDPGTTRLIDELNGLAGGSPELALRELGLLAEWDGQAFEALLGIAARRPPHHLKIQALEQLRRQVPRAKRGGSLPFQSWKLLQRLAREQLGVMEGLAQNHLELAQPEEMNSEMQIQEYWHDYYALLDLKQDAVLEPMAKRLKREARLLKRSRAWDHLPLRSGSLARRIRAVQLVGQVGPAAASRELDLASLKEMGDPALNQAVDQALAAIDAGLLKGRQGFLSPAQARDMESMIRNMGGLDRLRAKDPLLAAYYVRSRERIKHGKPRPALKEELKARPLVSPQPSLFRTPPVKE